MIKANTTMIIPIIVAQNAPFFFKKTENVDPNFDDK